MYLEKINGPADIKRLEVSQLQTLADETRSALINKISKAGGHQGPNLGVVTIEDGEVMGGYGQNIAAFYGDSEMRVHCHGLSKAFHTEFKADELLDAHGISVDKLFAEIGYIIFQHN